MPREFVREMDALFERLIDDRDSYVLRDVAAEALQWCQDNDPDLLEGWLKLQAEDMMHRVLSQRESGQRAKASRANAHAVFEAALRSASSGGDQAQAKTYLSMLDTRFACDAKQSRKKYGQMTKDEVTFVAGTYGKLERRSQLRRVFHETVAAELSDGQTVADVFGPHRLLAIQHELGIAD